MVCRAEDLRGGAARGGLCGTIANSRRIIGYTPGRMNVRTRVGIDLRVRDGRESNGKGGSGNDGGSEGKDGRLMGAGRGGILHGE